MEHCRLLIVDDHAVVRRGLRRYVEMMSSIELVAEAESGPEAIALAPLVAPDVILLDLMMPGMDGIATALILKQRLPSTPIIMLTGTFSHQSLMAALRVGVNGFLLKHVGIEELALAIRTVRSGQPYLQPCVANELISDVLQPAVQVPILTSRERQIYELLSAGMTNRQIAAKLQITEKTTSVHVSNLMGKLGLRNRTQVALAALQPAV